MINYVIICTILELQYPSQYSIPHNDINVRVLTDCSDGFGLRLL